VHQSILTVIHATPGLGYNDLLKQSHAFLFQFKNNMRDVHKCVCIAGFLFSVEK